jgi:gamma-glutamyl-gamma-aminobutyraldehyde dehydrogenase
MLLSRTQLIRNNLEERALPEFLDMGKLVSNTATIDISGSAVIMQWHGEAADKLYDKITSIGRAIFAWPIPAS